MSVGKPKQRWGRKWETGKTADDFLNDLACGAIYPERVDGEGRVARGVDRFWERLTDVDLACNDANEPAIAAALLWDPGVDAQWGCRDVALRARKAGGGRRCGKPVEPQTLLRVIRHFDRV